MHLIFYGTHKSLSESESQGHTHNFKMPTRKHKQICFGAYFYSADTQRGNLLVTWSDEQGGLFYSVGPHMNWC